MRDRDALLKARASRDAVNAFLPDLERARQLLRDWSGAGQSGGEGGGNAGAHSDPTLAALKSAEVTTPEGKHLGYRPLDPHGDHLRALDADLLALYDTARALAKDIAAIVNTPTKAPEAGCELCNSARLPVNTVTGQAEHKCDEDCAKAQHQHPNSWQKIYNRLAPAQPIEGADPLPNRARCSFHFDFAERYGVDAHKDITLWHLDHPGPGSRVPLEMIRRLHPEEFALRHGASRQRDRMWLGGTRA